MHTDHLGTPLALTNTPAMASQAAAAWRASYAPFGGATVDQDPDGDLTAVSLSLRFAGQLDDQELALNYNYFRTYDPAAGRYLTTDPIGQLGGTNVYRYALNSPLHYIDPRGLINLLAGVGGSGAAPTGGEASGGIVVNPGFGAPDADIGMFASVGATIGVNVSGDIFLGYVEGDIRNVSGTTVNQNFGVGPISITTFHDPRTGELIGGTAGWGLGATPVGYSMGYDVTSTLTLRDLLRWLSGAETPSLCEERR
jgi:RHS repeat-associated protein